MAIKRIKLSDLTFGKPRAWDWFRAPPAGLNEHAHGTDQAPGQHAELETSRYARGEAPASVLHSLNWINHRLDAILMDLRNVASADTELRAISRELIDTVARDENIALAAIFLNQLSGVYTVRHCTEAAIIVCLLARAMGKDRAEQLIMTAAALTMNVGMVRQTEIFQHREGALTSEERALVKRHPTDGVDLLRSAGITDEAWLDLVLLHHENDDGSGYPRGRLGDEISQNAKLIVLADRYCAFVSARNYRRSLLPPMALACLAGESAMPVDHEVIARFTQQIGAHPPGTLVRLVNGETGVVSSRADALGTLRVHVLRSGAGTLLALAEQRSTGEPGCVIDEALHEDSAKLRFTMEHIWGAEASL